MRYKRPLIYRVYITKCIYCDFIAKNNQQHIIYAALAKWTPIVCDPYVSETYIYAVAVYYCGNHSYYNVRVQRLSVWESFFFRTFLYRYNVYTRMPLYITYNNTVNARGGLTFFTFSRLGLEHKNCLCTVFISICKGFHSTVITIQSLYNIRIPSGFCLTIIIHLFIVIIIIFFFILSYPSLLLAVDTNETPTRTRQNGVFPLND